MLKCGLTNPGVGTIVLLNPQSGRQPVATVTIAEGKEVGRRLASVRVLRGLTQQELAQRSRVGLSTLVRAEAGSYSADTVVKLNGVLETSLDYLLSGVGAP